MDEYDVDEDQLLNALEGVKRVKVVRQSVRVEGPRQVQMKEVLSNVSVVEAEAWRTAGAASSLLLVEGRWSFHPR